MSNIPSVKLNDGQTMPMLGLGTSRLEDAYTSVKTALELGYRHIDTAAMYGNEAEVGRAVRDSGLPRDDIFITTKLANNEHDDVEGALKASLKRLDIDYIDLFLIHWPMPERVASWKVLEKLLESGAPIRSIGVSNFTRRHMDELLRQTDVVPAVNQFEFNPFVYQPELLEYNQSQGVQVVAYSPMTRGRKTDNPMLAEISQSIGKTPSQILLRWSIQHGVAVIPKASSAEHQKDNMDIFNWELSVSDMAKLNDLFDDSRVTEDPEIYP